MATRALLSPSSRIAGQLAAASINLRGGGVRAYAAAAAAGVARQEPSSAAGAAASRLAEDATAASKKDGFFWMMNPKKGYWMPENHFGDVDAADLRARLLFSNKHYN